MAQARRPRPNGGRIGPHRFGHNSCFVPSEPKITSPRALRATSCSRLGRRDAGPCGAHRRGYRGYGLTSSRMPKSLVLFIHSAFLIFVVGKQLHGDTNTIPADQYFSVEGQSVSSDGQLHFFEEKGINGAESSVAAVQHGQVLKIENSPSIQTVRAAWSSLLVYARLGMLAKGKLLVEPRLRGSTPVSLLMSAAISGDIFTLQRLLAEGTVLVDGKNEAGETALMHAAVGGSVDAVQALIDYGADINAHDSQGWTALMKVETTPPPPCLTELRFGCSGQSSQPLHFAAARLGQ